MTAGTGIVVLAAATGLLLPGVPALAAPGPGSPAPSDVVPGTDTATPALVSGLHEAAADKGSAADAARGHLAAKKGRYHIPDPARDLKSAGTQRDGRRETVRLQQSYKGVRVLGGQYVVRMETEHGERTVTGTSGRYFTGLKLGTVRPEVSAKTAIERAVGAVAAQPGGQGMLHRPAKGRKSVRARLSGTSAGLTILPQGDGVLTRHITVTGVDAQGAPVEQEVYVDGHSGFPVLQYSAIQTFGAPRAADTGDGGRAAADAGDMSAAAGQQLVVKGTGTRYNGEKAELNLYQGTDGAYQMIDYGFLGDEPGHRGGLLQTYDARGVEVAAASGRWPSGIKVFRSDTTDLGAEFTDSGAVDAHWAANQVYGYYKSKFDRDSLDGKGGYVNSLVGVVAGGQPYDNAFWDGTKMVYGKGGGDYRTFSADADVVGHEMTHGVVEHTAGLVYAGQSGAMNEAIADYFGNAIDVEANHQSMDDPDASLLGEDLCTTKGPRECALRDLNDGATTSRNFIGVTYRGDSGGVHLNSTIFSGALWDIREDLGGDLADEIVYRALSAYMTPLDGFTQGRAAVIAAARELGVTKAQLKRVRTSFAAHGIVPGWELALGVDTDTLIQKDNIADTGVSAANGRYAVSRTDAEGGEPYSVWTGRTDGRGRPQLLSGNNGNYNVYATTDGTNVAWAEYATSQVNFHVRPVRGGIDKVVGGIGANVSSLSLDGDYLVYQVPDPYTGNPHVTYTDIKTGETKLVNSSYVTATALPSVRDGKIAYAKMWPERTGYKLGVEVFDIATGATTLMPVDKDTVYGIGQTALTDDGVTWIEDQDGTDQGQAAVRRAALDGSDPATVVPESKDSSLFAYTLTASDDAITFTSLPPATTWDNATLPKLYQVAPDGKRGVQRMSCNRGDQVWADADTGKRVVWLDGTTGWTSVVKRDRPAGKCG